MVKPQGVAGSEQRTGALNASLDPGAMGINIQMSICQIRQGQGAIKRLGCEHSVSSARSLARCLITSSCVLRPTASESHCVIDGL